MRSPLPAVCLLALTACDPSSPPPPDRGEVRTREVQRVVAVLESAPEGVRITGEGPYCTLEERTGGAYGKPRYVVRVTIANGLAYPPAEADREVFFEVSVDAGGRRFDGWVSTGEVQAHDLSSLHFVPPSELGSNFSSLEMGARDWAATQEVPGNLEACRLRIVDPDEPAKALGGYVVQTSENGEWMVIAEDGTHRPAGEA